MFKGTFPHSDRSLFLWVCTREVAPRGVLLFSAKGRKTSMVPKAVFRAERLFHVCFLET